MVPKGPGSGFDPGRYRGRTGGPSTGAVRTRGVEHMLAHLPRKRLRDRHQHRAMPAAFRRSHSARRSQARYGHGLATSAEADLVRAPGPVHHW